MIKLELTHETFNEVLKHLTGLEEYLNLQDYTEKADKVYKLRQQILVARSK